MAKNTDNKGQKNTENAIENETTQSRPDKDENVDSDDKAEVGATAADSEMQETESMQETVQTAEGNAQTAEGETIENQENISDTTPVNASTATILGYSFNEESTDAEKILELLDSYAGVLPFSEKASPEVIKRETGLSKAAFKRAIGHLYKERKITLDGGKIRKSFV